MLLKKKRWPCLALNIVLVFNLGALSVIDTPVLNYFWMPLVVDGATFIEFCGYSWMVATGAVHQKNYIRWLFYGQPATNIN